MNRSMEHLPLLTLCLLIPILYFVCQGFAKCQDARFQKQFEEQLKQQAREEQIREANATPSPTPAPTVDPYTYEIPFVGMSEKNINQTQYSRTFNMTFEYYDGKTFTRYYSDGKGTSYDPKYMLVVCKNSVVTLVIDRRNNPWREDPQPYTRKKKNDGSAGKKKKDDYYGDAEEFYYDHIEEFDDFDEAEEYYNEHFR